MTHDTAPCQGGVAAPGPGPAHPGGEGGQQVGGGAGVQTHRHSGEHGGAGLLGDIEH